MARVVLYQSVISNYLRGPNSPVVRENKDIARRTAILARAAAPVELGQLKASISVESKNTRAGCSSSIGVLSGIMHAPRPWAPNAKKRTVASVAMYQDRGVGPISAKRGKPMRFRYKGKWQSRSSTSGVPSTEFLFGSLKKASPYPCVELIPKRG